jgi:hypothetical protein
VDRLNEPAGVAAASRARLPIVAEVGQALPPLVVLEVSGVAAGLFPRHEAALDPFPDQVTEGTMPVLASAEIAAQYDEAVSDLIAVLTCACARGGVQIDRHPKEDVAIARGTATVGGVAATALVSISVSEDPATGTIAVTA